MRIHLLAVAVAGALLAVGCSKDHAPGPAGLAGAQPTSKHSAGGLQAGSQIAALPDLGELVHYDAIQTPLHRGAATFYPVQMSEQRAMRAIAEGGMVVAAPDGSPIRLQYTRHVEHDDGNWTWVGRTAGGVAVLTFGEKAVFGSIPGKDGQPLQVTTVGGRTFVVQTDPRAIQAAGDPVADAPDFVKMPAAHPQAGLVAAASAMKSAAPATAQAAPAQAVTASAATSTPAPIVDVVVGYTSGFATRLGGRSQALTRLNFLVDLTNQAYADSQVTGRIRMVGAVQVNYPDATSNQSALFELSGLACSSAAVTKPRTPDNGESCTPAAVPAALQPLVKARETFGADLVSLVRNFNDPENGTCGVSWLIGAGQTPIIADDARYGYSIVSDSNGGAFPDNGNTCREEYFAHELGHNMGLQHDRATAQQSDDTNGDGILLDPEEYGRFPYSFGYNAGTNAGNFATIMALRRSGQTAYRVFSNPRITFCGGFACGLANQADDATALGQTMPLIAAFHMRKVHADFNGDGHSDVLWRHDKLGANSIWKSASRSTTQPVSTLADLHWKVAGTGDFDGDGQADILWRNTSTGSNAIWRSGRAGSQLPVAAVTDQGWQVAGIADFDGDGRADILWHHDKLGANSIWKSANRDTPQPVSTLTDLHWKIAGVGDFDGDGQADILLRNDSTGSNTIWKSGRSGTQQAVAAVTDLAWKVVGVGDFDGDGRADILWRHDKLGADSIWKSANRNTSQPVSTLADLNWKVVDVGDFDGDGRSDILWRHFGTGNNAIWLSGRSGLQQPIDPVTDLAWKVAG